MTILGITIDLPFWGWVIAVIFIFTVGVVSSRILGVRRGLLRATVAGVIGTFVGLIVVAVFFGDDPDPDGTEFFFVLFGFATLATMVFSIVLEVVLRPRRTIKRASFRHRAQSFFTIGGRLFEVIRIARRNGLANPRITSKAAMSSPEGALRVRKFLEECGGIFIKFGQIASTRADLLPPQLVTELSDLQSNVKKVPSDQIRTRVEHELNAPISQTFESFSDEPLAAASIGQTHVAVLKNGGRRVVIKVRRPNIEVGVVRDSAVLKWASRVAVRRSEAAKAIGLVPLADELVRSVEQELSYVREAANARALSAGTPNEGVQIPSVEESLSTDAVLVLQRIAGRPVSDAAAVDAAAVERPVLADRLLGAFLNQVMIGGVFHADPHPGNILIDEQGTLWLIDFGAVGVIDAVTMEALQLIAAGLATGQPSLLARALRVISGPAGDDIDPRGLEAELSRMLSEQLHGGGFDPASLQEMIEIMGRHGIPVPPTFTLLARSLVTLEGTLRLLDPNMRMAQAAAQRLGGAMQLTATTAQEALQKELLRTMPSIRALPALTEDIALQLRSGRIRLQLDPFAGSSNLHVTRWVDQALFAAVGGAGLVASAVLLIGAFLAPVATNGPLLWIGYFGLVLSSVMLMRVVAQILRREPEVLAQLTPALAR